MPPNPIDVDEEEKHFSNVVSTFRNYASYALSANNRRRKDLYTLPIVDQKILTELGYKKKLDDVDHAITQNAQFLSQIVSDTEIFGNELPFGGEGEKEEEEKPLPSYSHSHDGPAGHSHSHDHAGPSHSHSHGGGRGKKYKPTEFDMDKLRSTLKQFVRDWSGEGREEREAAYKPMKDALLEHFHDIPPNERRSFRVLVPGAGLGRLAWDVAHLGFACQGNEFSHYMLLASFFILNRTHGVNIHTLYPYVHSFSNIPDRKAMLQPITIPDVLPSSLPEGVDFSLVAGDFEEIYGVDHEEGEPQAGQWDAIMTCFFIDTAKNIVNYLRIIHRILAPGGIWINLGPLLWHWENNQTNDPSVELDLEQVKALINQMGFDISNEKTIDTTYTNNKDSMLGYVYRTAFWTAKKRI